MVRKLLKHEFAYYAKSLFLFEGVLLCVAILNRLMIAFESSDDSLYSFVTYSLTAVAIFGCVACVIMAFVMILSRFYKNLFTHEGYLMFTLPVSETQHVAAKLIAAVAAMISSVVTAILYWVIILSDLDFMQEIWISLQDFLNLTMFEVGAHLYAFLAEAVVLLLLSSACSILFYYMCIALGQATMIKNRILAAVGVYFLLSLIGQFLSPILNYVTDRLYNAFFSEWYFLHPIAGTHITLVLLCVLYAAASAVCFIVTRYIMRHKLNLE